MIGICWEMGCVIIQITGRIFSHGNRTYDVIHETTPETFGFKMDKSTVNLLRRGSFNELTPAEQGAVLTPVSKESSVGELSTQRLTGSTVFRRRLLRLPFLLPPIFLPLLQ